MLLPGTKLLARDVVVLRDQSSFLKGRVLAHEANHLIFQEPASPQPLRIQYSYIDYVLYENPREEKYRLRNGDRIRGFFSHKTAQKIYLTNASSDYFLGDNRLPPEEQFFRQLPGGNWQSRAWRREKKIIKFELYRSEISRGPPPAHWAVAMLSGAYFPLDELNRAVFGPGAALHAQADWYPGGRSLTAGRFLGGKWFLAGRFWFHPPLERDGFSTWSLGASALNGLVWSPAGENLKIRGGLSVGANRLILTTSLGTLRETTGHLATHLEISWQISPDWQIFQETQWQWLWQQARAKTGMVLLLGGRYQHLAW